MKTTSVIAGGCSTIGKLPIILEGHCIPSLVASACGARFKDDQDVEWLDFDMALGSVVWGYGRVEFADAVRDTLIHCSTSSVPTAIENEAALELLDRLSVHEQVRFLKTGADACTAAVRISRAATGKTHFAVDGYHGWHDWSVAWAYPDDVKALGILPSVKNDVVFLDPNRGIEAAKSSMITVGDRLSGVMIRPEAWPPDSIREIARICGQSGGLLVFDEVTSHYKYGKTGAGGALGIAPDLLCISKGLANGMPLAAILGPERLMRFTVSARISSTYASESAAFAAMLVGEQLLAESAEWPSWRKPLRKVTTSVQESIRDFGLLEMLELVIHPGFFSIQRKGVSFKTDPFRYHLVGELADHGLFTRGWFHGSDRHTDSDWERLIESISHALKRWVERVNCE